VHPRYRPRLDAWRNRWLPKGTCCICQEHSVSVFKLECAHSVCIEDLKGYMDTALGDISMFPVKCAMHFEGCTGIIDAHVAKRIMTEPLYQRFLDFSDRATYGDGMRCIYCNNFVNFPLEGMSAAMVECPYCVQNFCMRCKKPWHYGGKCPLDHVDDSLEVWKQDSGAQKCPCCHKLIEKDDPDTCNHMVHKITDGIPCVRDRTDFCCKSSSSSSLLLSSVLNCG
jgi:IBR domain, a half RING-finger domain